MTEEEKQSIIEQRRILYNAKRRAKYISKRNPNKLPRPIIVASLKASRKAYSKSYYIKNKQKLIENQLEYNRSNPEATRERQRKYYQDHKEAISKKNRKYSQARKLKYPKYIIPKEKKRLYIDNRRKKMGLGPVVKRVILTKEEKRIKTNANQIKWYHANKEKAKSYRTNYYQNNKERVIEKARIRYQLNKEIITEKARIKYHLKKHENF